MPCDTPPPPSSVGDLNDENDDSIEEIDDSYDFIEDAYYPEDEDDEIVIEDDSIDTFVAHKDSVFCCSIDRSDSFLVTGGQDDIAYVWDVVNKSIKFECTGHLESVIAASFSPDSKYVATADMNGLIQVWNMDDGTLIWNFETYEIQWLKWLNGENSFIAGGSDGTFWKWSVPNVETTVFPNPNVSCCTGAISQNDEKVVTGYSDGTIKFWNLPNSTILSTLSGPNAHTSAVIVIKFNADNSLILTGSEDGTAKIIKTSDYKVLWTINGCESSQHQHEIVSVEDVGFCHSLPYIAIGTNCGILSIWDINTKIRRAQSASSSSIIRIKCDKLAPIIYIAIADGMLQAHDARTGEAVKYWRGHKGAILDLALSSDCRLLLTASDDHTCKLFQRGMF